MARTLSPEISNKGRVVLFIGIWRESFDGEKRLSIVYQLVFERERQLDVRQDKTDFFFFFFKFIGNSTEVYINEMKTRAARKLVWNTTLFTLYLLL